MTLDGETSDRGGDRAHRRRNRGPRADPGQVGGAGRDPAPRGARPLEAGRGGRGPGRAQLHRGHAAPRRAPTWARPPTRSTGAGRGVVRGVAGPWLKDALDGLRGPDGLRDAAPPRGLRAELRPYQAVGVRWLRLLQRLGLGACLADDMGLGKTSRSSALLLALKERSAARPRPAAARERASPRGPGVADRQLEGRDRPLRAVAARPRRPPLRAPEKAVAEASPPDDLAAADLVITTYGLTHRLRWLAGDRVAAGRSSTRRRPSRTPATKQARAVKALRARSRVALTGTPVENRLADLWSLFDFLNPGLLGSARAFGSFAAAARPARGRLRAAPRADAALHPAAAQDRPAGHRRSAGQDGAARLLRAEQASRPRSTRSR